MSHRLAAEFVGTMVLVFGGCGSAVISAGFPGGLGIGFLGVALAFGFTVLVMIYAVGHVSGGHFNPAVTLGAAAAGRFAWKDVPLYVVVQLLGAAVPGPRCSTRSRWVDRVQHGRGRRVRHQRLRRTVPGRLPAAVLRAGRDRAGRSSS